jgi:hypothetical protein
MKTEQLVGIALFTFVVVITLYGWMDRIQKRNPVINEAFQSTIVNNDGPGLTQEDLDRLTKANEPTPSEQDAVKAHQTLLYFIRNDFGKGIKFVMDFGDRFYGKALPLKPDLDVRTLTVDYKSPLDRF